MDQYTMVRVLGEGSFGSAVLAQHKTTSKLLVLKRIPLRRLSPQAVNDAKKEVQVLSSLNHPHVTKFMHSLEYAGELVIAMEYCSGGDLRSILQQRDGALFPQDRILDWFVQLCLAVKYIHDKHILHRDIKTQNIFLTEDGRIKLGDFGISKVLENSKDLANTCIGTPYYLSPEMCQNKPYNSKSDVWALGCVLYEMTVLKHPFEATCMKSLIMKIVKGSFRPVPAKFSWDLKALIRQILQSNPTCRPSVTSVLAKKILIERVPKFLDGIESSHDLYVALRARKEMEQSKGKGSNSLSVGMTGPAAKYGQNIFPKKNGRKSSPLKNFCQSKRNSPKYNTKLSLPIARKTPPGALKKSPLNANRPESGNVSNKRVKSRSVEAISSKRLSVPALISEEGKRRPSGEVKVHLPDVESILKALSEGKYCAKSNGTKPDNSVESQSNQSEIKSFRQRPIVTSKSAENLLDVDNNGAWGPRLAESTHDNTYFNSEGFETDFVTATDDANEIDQPHSAFTDINQTDVKSAIDARRKLLVSPEKKRLFSRDLSPVAGPSSPYCESPEARPKSSRMISSQDIAISGKDELAESFQQNTNANVAEGSKKNVSMAMQTCVLSSTPLRHPRSVWKAWDPTPLAEAPLETTRSKMDATSSADEVILHVQGSANSILSLANPLGTVKSSKPLIPTDDGCCKGPYNGAAASQVSSMKKKYHRSKSFIASTEQSNDVVRLSEERRQWQKRPLDDILEVLNNARVAEATLDTLQTSALIDSLAAEHSPVKRTLSSNVQRGPDENPNAHKHPLCDTSLVPAEMANNLCDFPNKTFTLTSDSIKLSDLSQTYLVSKSLAPPEQSSKIPNCEAETPLSRTTKPQKRLLNILLRRESLKKCPSEPDSNLTDTYVVDSSDKLLSETMVLSRGADTVVNASENTDVKKKKPKRSLSDFLRRIVTQKTLTSDNPSSVNVHEKDVDNHCEYVECVSRSSSPVDQLGMVVSSSDINLDIPLESDLPSNRCEDLYGVNTSKTEENLPNSSEIRNQKQSYTLMSSVATEESGYSTRSHISENTAYLKNSTDSSKQSCSVSSHLISSECVKDGSADTLQLTNCTASCLSATFDAKNTAEKGSGFVSESKSPDAKDSSTKDANVDSNLQSCFDLPASGSDGMKSVEIITDIGIDSEWTDLNRVNSLESNPELFVNGNSATNPTTDVTAIQFSQKCEQEMLQWDADLQKQGDIVKGTENSTDYEKEVQIKRIAEILVSSIIKKSRERLDDQLKLQNDDLDHKGRGISNSQNNTESFSIANAVVEELDCKLEPKLNFQNNETDEKNQFATEIDLSHSALANSAKTLSSNPSSGVIGTSSLETKIVDHLYNCLWSTISSGCSGSLALDIDSPDIKIDHPKNNNICLSSDSSGEIINRAPVGNPSQSLLATEEYETQVDDLPEMETEAKNSSEMETEGKDSSEMKFGAKPAESKEDDMPEMESNKDGHELELEVKYEPELYTKTKNANDLDSVCTLKTESQPEQPQCFESNSEITFTKLKPAQHENVVDDEAPAIYSIQEDNFSNEYHDEQRCSGVEQASKPAENDHSSSITCSSICEDVDVGMISLCFPPSPSHENDEIKSDTDCSGLAEKSDEAQKEIPPPNPNLNSVNSDLHRITSLLLDKETIVQNSSIIKEEKSHFLCENVNLITETKTNLDLSKAEDSQCVESKVGCIENTKQLENISPGSANASITTNLLQATESNGITGESENYTSITQVNTERKTDNLSEAQRNEFLSLPCDLQLQTSGSNEVKISLDDGNDDETEAVGTEPHISVLIGSNKTVDTEYTILVRNSNVKSRNAEPKISNKKESGETFDTEISSTLKLPSLDQEDAHDATTIKLDPLPARAIDTDFIHKDSRFQSLPSTGNEKYSSFESEWVNNECKKSSLMKPEPETFDESQKCQVFVENESVGRLESRILPKENENSPLAELKISDKRGDVECLEQMRPEKLPVLTAVESEGLLKNVTSDQEIEAVFDVTKSTEHDTLPNLCEENGIEINGLVSLAISTEVLVNRPENKPLKEDATQPLCDSVKETNKLHFNVESECLAESVFMNTELVDKSESPPSNREQKPKLLIDTLKQSDNTNSNDKNACLALLLSTNTELDESENPTLNGKHNAVIESLPISMNTAWEDLPETVNCEDESADVFGWIEQQKELLEDGLGLEIFMHCYRVSTSVGTSSEDSFLQDVIPALYNITGFQGTESSGALHVETNLEENRQPKNVATPATRKILLELSDGGGTNASEIDAKNCDFDVPAKNDEASSLFCINTDTKLTSSDELCDKNTCEETVSSLSSTCDVKSELKHIQSFQNCDAKPNESYQNCDTKLQPKTNESFQNCDPKPQPKTKESFHVTDNNLVCKNGHVDSRQDCNTNLDDIVDSEKHKSLGRSVVLSKNPGMLDTCGALSKNPGMLDTCGALSRNPGILDTSSMACRNIGDTCNLSLASQNNTQALLCLETTYKEPSFSNTSALRFLDTEEITEQIFEVETARNTRDKETLLNSIDETHVQENSKICNNASLDIDKQNSSLPYIDALAKTKISHCHSAASRIGDTGVDNIENTDSLTEHFSALKFSTKFGLCFVEDANGNKSCSVQDLAKLLFALVKAEEAFY